MSNICVGVSCPMPRLVPSNIRLASAFIASVPVAVRTLSLEPFDKKSETSTEIASAATSIPVPAPIFRVLLDAIVPPPVKPAPATMLTPVWSICSFATNPVVSS